VQLKPGALDELRRYYRDFRGRSPKPTIRVYARQSATA
jgi:hypothetical protein